MTRKLPQPSTCLARANTAILALLDAIGRELHPASKSSASWAQVGDANHLVSVLRDAYMFLSSGDERRSFELPTSDGRGTVVFEAGGDVRVIERQEDT